MIILIDASESSLTVSWPAVPQATHYILQYCHGRPQKSEGGEDDDRINNSIYITLSDKLSTTFVRKKNLEDPDGVGFTFRVAAVYGDLGISNCQQRLWITHSNVFYLLTEHQLQHRISEPPTVEAESHAALISWKPLTEITTTLDGSTTLYELQMRENNGGQPWSTITSELMSTQVRKKNLTSTLGYQFRVRSIPSHRRNTELEIPFSPPSKPTIFPMLETTLNTEVFPSSLRTVFSSLYPNPKLQQKTSLVDLEDALSSKEFILLYASAHWCPPCRQFTPRLVQYYNQVHQTYGPNVMEIVFLSADNGRSSFREYYAGMPWLAVPFDEETAREEIMEKLEVRGIPRLVLYDGVSGRILEQNCVGSTLDVLYWRQLAAQTRHTK